jgi:PhzF family phenazine biosynthesis protein
MHVRVEIVNGFTYNRRGGNEAGVVVTDRLPPDGLMQKIAAKAGFSETVFVEARNDMFICRFFTPDCEVELCGHATIAAFYLLAEKGYIKGKSRRRTVSQLTQAGRLRVSIAFTEEGDVGSVMMEQARPKILGKIEGVILDRLCEVLGIARRHIGLHSAMDAQPEVISTGLPDVILPIVNREQLSAIRPDFDRLAMLSKEIGVVGVHAFTLQADRPDSNVSCRNFGPAVGINEEAATGTSNGALGVYLFRRGMLSDRRMVSEQGFDMGKPSVIYVEVSEDEVWVGGQAAKTGEISIEL